jgi:hypothetical protein
MRNAPPRGPSPAHACPAHNLKPAGGPLRAYRTSKIYFVQFANLCADRTCRAAVHATHDATMMRRCTDARRGGEGGPRPPGPWPDHCQMHRCMPGCSGLEYATTVPAGIHVGTHIETSMLHACWHVGSRVSLIWPCATAAAALHVGFQYPPLRPE